MAIDWDKLVLGPCERVFGEPALFIPAGQQPFTIAAVFDENFIDLSELEGVRETAEQPIATVRLAAWPSGRRHPIQGDQIAIHSVKSTYRVNEVRLDGKGGAMLMLNYAGPA